MKKTLLTFITFITALVALAQGNQNYEINVGDFNKLRVIDGINVDYRQHPDSTGKVVFACPRSMATAIIVSNKSGSLKLELATECVDWKNLPTLRVYSSSLMSVENSGDSTVRVLTPVQVPKFSAKVVGNGRLSVRDCRADEFNGSLQMGNGSIVVAGECKLAKYNMLGTGVIEADALKADEVKIHAGGTGSIGVWAVDLLKIGGMGSTEIFYKGEPEIKKQLVAVGLKLLQLKQ